MTDLVGDSNSSCVALTWRHPKVNRDKIYQVQFMAEGEETWKVNEPSHGKTNNQHRQKQRALISFAVTAKLISAFVFATRIKKFLYFLNPKFPASNHLL